ncbi:MAG TPA: 60S ribosomal export protein NMD3 [Methanospirillum sp.]|nr:60S ribosomal export protein NMD3 [Methanospirillum sp.]
MDIHHAICPKCGEPSEEGTLCEKCRAVDIGWFKCEPRVVITRCGGCGSLKTAAGWGDSERSREDLEYDAAGSAIQFYQEVRSPKIEVKLEHISNNKGFAYLDISGNMFGDKVHDKCTVEIFWQNDSCDRCNRQHGNYYEGVVQVRADGRKASIEEQEEAQRIAVSVETNMQAEGNRLSFITRFDEGREGLDIVIGSQAIGEQIARDLTRRLGGKFSTHPTLIGEKMGQRLYRITYAVRLPRFRRGDIIAVRQAFGEVLHSEGKTINYLDLATGLPKTIPASLPIRHIGHVRDAELFQVIYIDGSIIGVMNESGKTEEIHSPSWRHPSQGDTVRIVRDEDRVLIV